MNETVFIAAMVSTVIIGWPLGFILTWRWLHRSERPESIDPQPSALPDPTEYRDRWEWTLATTGEDDRRFTQYDGDQADTIVEILTVLPTPMAGYQWQSEVVNADSRDFFIRNCQPKRTVWTLAPVEEVAE